MRGVIETLTEEIEDLRSKLAVEHMDVSEEGRLEAANLIEELRAEVKTLNVTIHAVTVARDRLMAENAQLKKQILAMQRQAKRTA